MAGAAQCFFGFVGFDAVATTGEEAKNPQRNIPLAIVISLVIIFLAYFGISAVLTMMWPYYDQDPKAPFPYVFDKIGWYTIKWIVTSGAVVALLTSLLGAMFPLPRVIYAMANDGLIFKFFAKIHPKTQTPLIATIFSGLFVGLMAILFDTDQLINMMSIGTLLAYTIVAVCVLILRYMPVEEDDGVKKIELNQELNGSYYLMFRQVFNLNMNKKATATSSMITNWSIVMFSKYLCGIYTVMHRMREHYGNVALAPPLHNISVQEEGVKMRCHSVRACGVLNSKVAKKKFFRYFRGDFRRCSDLRPGPL